MKTYTTTEVMAVLETGYWPLLGLIRSGLMRAPEKTLSGDFRWTRRQLAQARKLLAKRRNAKGSRTSKTATGPVTK